MKRFEYLSLFSGIGGFDLGFMREGMSCVGMCEIDKKAQDILRRHFPDVPLFKDVREVGAKTHEPKTIDLICGGFPCQDLSMAGKRKGLAGERSGLWFEFARVVDELEPRWVVIENVPGLLSSNRGRDFAVILHWLAQRGYSVVWRVLDARYFGVSQRRRRIFVVASFGNGDSIEVLFECESGTGNTESGKDKGMETASRVKGGPDESGQTLVMTHYGKGRITIARGFAPTLLANHEQPVVLENSRLRRLTPLEYERLQGFPDGWTAGLSDTARYRLLGNAVAVPVAEWLGRRILAIEKKTSVFLT